MFPTALAALLVAGLLRSPDTARAQLGAAVAAAILFVSPLCALGSAFFTARTGHHLALMLVLAPLVAMAMGPATGTRALPASAATALQAIVLWIWHAPPLYAAALSDDAVFWLMQLTLLGSAIVWWRALVRASVLSATANVLATMVQMGVLGALLVFAVRPFYAPHLLTTWQWGLSPLEDQQLAGLVMWVLGSGAYLALALVMIFRALPPAVAAPRRA